MFSSLLYFISNVMVTYGLPFMLILLILGGFGFPLPEDISVISGGILSSLHCSTQDTFVHTLFQCSEPHITILWAIAGIIFGDSVMYILGSRYGLQVNQWPMFRSLFTVSRVEFLQTKFQTNTWLILFVGRFLPGIRAAIFFVAGYTKVAYWKFWVIDMFACILSVPIWVYLGFWGAKQKDLILEYMHQGQTFIYGAVCLLLLIFFYKPIKNFISKKIFS
jgi:membrane protein DedA with SNARE-associated domain